MKDFLHNYKNWFFPGSVLVIVVGVIFIWMGMTQSITVVVDGEIKTFSSTALTVSAALREADIVLSDVDRVKPSLNSWLWKQSVIHIQSARDNFIITPEEELRLQSAERIPANLLLDLEIALFPQDQILMNGEIIDPYTPLDVNRSVFLQFDPATPVRLSVDERVRIIYSNQKTLGAALDAVSLHINPEDWISEDLSTPITSPMAVSIRRARPVSITSLDSTVTGMTAASTVGDALTDIGFPLQNLDYSIPPEDAPIKENGEITIIRVNETLTIATEEFPHDAVYEEDPNTPLDQIAVIESGQDGIIALRERARYENGEEVWRDVEEGWQASEPKTALMGRGSKVVALTEVVEGETLEYYRKLSVFATSYSPCNLGVDWCSDTTSSGMKLEKGAIGVTRPWFLAMRGQRVYVTGYGYGVIADVGGGYPDGRRWIDLGYTDENYRPWHHWVTMYLLTPIPAYVPLYLP